MLKQRKTVKRRIISIILVFATIFSAVIYFKMKPVIVKHALSSAETLMLNSANEAIIEIFESGNVTYSDIVTLSNNSDGYVTSLEINIYEINRLKAKISGEISKIISGKEKYEISVPLGAFLGNVYTSGMGPILSFKMQVTTTAVVNFTHEFKAAGINQVLHIINVNIDMKGTLLVAGAMQSVNVSTSAIAAQTVIVGKTPDAFTSVIESTESNTGGLINDYGAKTD